MKEIVSKNIDILLDSRKSASLCFTPEQMTFSNIENYAFSTMFRELIDATDIVFDTLGEADYLLTLKKEINDADLTSYTSRLYTIDIRPDSAVRRPAWWKYTPNNSMPEWQYQCSECYNLSDRAYRFCPHCGAKIMGVENQPLKGDKNEN